MEGNKRSRAYLENRCLFSHDFQLRKSLREQKEPQSIWSAFVLSNSLIKRRDET